MRTGLQSAGMSTCLETLMTSSFSFLCFGTFPPSVLSTSSAYVFPWSGVCGVGWSSEVAHCKPAISLS